MPTHHKLKMAFIKIFLKNSNTKTHIPTHHKLRWGSIASQNAIRTPTNSNSSQIRRYISPYRQFGKN